jgi:hypothetical protein
MYAVIAGEHRLSGRSERRNHVARARGGPEMRIDVLEGALQLGRFWAGGGTQPQVEVLQTLDPQAILKILSDGGACQFGAWALCAIPTRQTTGGDEGVDGWGSAVWVASIHGFRTFTGMDLQSIQSACGYITRRDHEVRKQQYMRSQFCGSGSTY